MGFLKTIGNALTGGLVGGVGNIASSLFTGWQNRQMQAQQNAFNREERLAAEQFQDQQRVSQNDWSEHMYNAYESPQARVQAFSDAGLNPRLASENVGNLSASSGSSGSGFMASPTSPPYLPYNAYSMPFAEMAQAFHAISEGKKAGVETDNLVRTVEEQIRGMRLENDARDFLNMIDKQYLEKEKQQALSKLAQDIATGKATEDSIRKQIDVLELDKGIKKNELDHWLESYELNTREKQSNIRANNASAESMEIENSFNQWKGVVGNFEKKAFGWLKDLGHSIGLGDLVDGLFDSVDSDEERTEVDSFEKWLRKKGYTDASTFSPEYVRDLYEEFKRGD